MQNDFIDGVLGSDDARAIVPKVKEKIKEYQDNGDRIIFTQDTHYDYEFSIGEDITFSVENKMIPPHCLYGTNGWNIPEDIDVKNATHLRKNSFGSSLLCYEFFDDEATDTIEIIGLCTDICVISNALMLRSDCLCCRIIVDASCCAGTTPEKHCAALDVMESCLIEVINKGE